MKIKQILGLSIMVTFMLFSSLPTKEQDKIEVVDFNELIQLSETPEVEVYEVEIEAIEETKVEEDVINEEDLRYMASIIYAEAGNQCEAGQRAVGIVVMNRVYSDLFADTVYDVIYQKGQFSPVTDGNLNKALNLYDKGELPQSCIDAAIYALEDNTLVCYNDNYYEMNDYYFFSRYVKNARLSIQDHMFK
jgi:hypothetical protein